MSRKIKLTFTEPLLGTITKDPEVYAAYIASRAALTDEDLAEELATVEKVEEKGWTGFHMLDGQPILYDYVIKGFFKDACGMLRRVKGSGSSKLRAYKKEIDGLVFVYKKEIDGLVFVTPRQIPLVLPEGAELGLLERPLRASTAQGDRVALARSDTCPPGTTLTFTLAVLGGGIGDDLLREWFNYGALRGLGQWRNASYGRFEWEELG
jgi:hypothetical protein